MAKQKYNEEDFEEEPKDEEEKDEFEDFEEAEEKPKAKISKPIKREEKIEEDEFEEEEEIKEEKPIVKEKPKQKQSAPVLAEQERFIARKVPEITGIIDTRNNTWLTTDLWEMLAILKNDMEQVKKSVGVEQ